jgi:hypothetical protein
MRDDEIVVDSDARLSVRLRSHIATSNLQPLELPVET